LAQSNTGAAGVRPFPRCLTSLVDTRADVGTPARVSARMEKHVVVGGRWDAWKPVQLGTYLPEVSIMGIGASLFLIAVGAILTFGINQDSVGFINIDVIGWILMLVGVFGAALTSYYWNRRRHVVVDERGGLDERPVVGETPVVREQTVRERDYRSP
jgi:hypothetical protein